MKMILAIDIGTTHSKGVVADYEGIVCWSDRHAYDSSQPGPGFHEQDPDSIRAAVQKLIADATEKFPTVDAVCFSAAMHSLVLADATGKPLYPMLTWADTRSSAIAADLKDTDLGRRIYEQTGTPVHPMSPLCKIAWFRKQDPSLFKNTARFISIKEYIWFHLTGEFRIDHSLASATGLFDIRTRDWSSDALAFAGISSEQLSSPVPTTYSTTLNGIRYIIGASDGALANIGTGSVQEGKASLTIGTSGAVRVFNRQPLADPRQRLFNYIVDEEYYVTGGAINNGGITLKWFVDTFYNEAEGEDLGKLISDADHISAGSEGLIFLPYIYGERAVVWDARTQGVFFGIRSVHTKTHFLRAVLEGICFSLKQIVEAMEECGEKIELVSASGGFTASQTWLRIMSDILGKTVTLTQDTDASAMGAVYLAIRTSSHTGSWAEFFEQYLPAETGGTEQILPDSADQPAYTRNYTIYSRLYDQLKDQFHMADGPLLP